MDQPPLFKWRHCAGEIIVCGVRWYLRYALSYRDVEELMQERGGSVDHTTVFRWVQRYAPELDKRCRPHLPETNDSYRVDETYIKIKKPRYYLYRAVDSAGQTIDFLLSKTRDAQAAERFFRKALRATHTATPASSPSIRTRPIRQPSRHFNRRGNSHQVVGSGNANT